MASWYAHSKKDDSDKHLLSHHLDGTRKLATLFCNHPLMNASADFTAFIHDIGKYHDSFQRRLDDARIRVEHAKWGAIWARALKCDAVSRCICGHHIGLQDSQAWLDATTLDSQERERETANELIKRFLSDCCISENDFKNIVNQAQKEFISQSDNYSELEQEIAIRYLFSCLTDADWLDTERYFDNEKFDSRPDMILNIDLFLNKLDKKFADLGSNENSTLNQLRNQVRQYALTKAENSTGFFSLNLPTGLGKTLASFQWALVHARKNNLKRIIIVLPFVNIIDQTAKTLRDILGDENVLEHHSSLNEDEIMDNENDYDKRKLACENWNYPVIVTTTVQFFESLFHNKPAHCRKIHNIANSVVIFDEVQTLPKTLALPTLNMLENVQKVLNTSFIFCTATMPAFQKREHFDGIENIISLVEYPEELFQQTIRVKFNFINKLAPIEMNELLLNVNKMHGSTLAVFNTKKAAQSFFIAAKEGHWKQIYHLSTNMCPAHRKHILNKIKHDIDKRILVVSTQLIEAGVDLDFTNVFRAIAPLESIIQSAGRCNREGKLEFGNVYLFALVDERYPGTEYKQCAGHAKDLLICDPKLIYTHALFSSYYAAVMQMYIKSNPITELRKEFKYETVKNSYRIIDTPTKPVFIYEYNEISLQIYNEIKDKSKLSKKDYQNIQQYIINFYDKTYRENMDNISRLKCGIDAWYGKYDKQDMGLEINGELENLIY